LFSGKPERLAEFKSLATSYRTSVITSDEFLQSFINLALEDKSSENARKNAVIEAGKAWTHLAETVPDDGSSSNLRGRGKREDMLRAWNDYRVMVCCVSMIA
jgi:hypothetical protein